MDAVQSASAVATAERASAARFGAYLYTQFFSAFNDNVHQMAIALYLAHASGALEGEAGKWQSIISAAFVAPFILFSSLAGTLADRFEKRTILIAAKWLEVVPMSVSLVSTFLPAPAQYYGLIAGIFLMEVRAAFFSPAKYGILPEITGSDRLVRANGILQMLTMVAIVSGEAVGGLVINGFILGGLAVSPYNIRIAISICLGIAVVGSLLAIWIPRGAPGDSSRPIQANPLSQVWSAVRQMRADRILVITTFTLSAFWMVATMFRMNIPLFGRFALEVKPFQTSLLWVFVSVGIGIGAALAGIVKKSDESMGLVLPGAIGMAVASAAAGLLGRDFTGSAAILAILGLFGGLYLVPQTAIFQARSPADRRGAYLAVQNFANYAFMAVAAGIFFLMTGKLGLKSREVFIVVGIGLAGLGAVQCALQPALVVGMAKVLLSRIFGVKAAATESKATAP